MTDKVELEGKLFVLIEEDKDETSVCAEVAGVDIWEWLEHHNGYDIKITLEVKDKEKKND